jgi:hypothetical protein
MRLAPEASKWVNSSAMPAIVEFANSTDASRFA